MSLALSAASCLYVSLSLSLPVQTPCVRVSRSLSLPAQPYVYVPLSMQTHVCVCVYIPQCHCSPVYLCVCSCHHSLSQGSPVCLPLSFNVIAAPLCLCVSVCLSHCSWQICVCVSLFLRTAPCVFVFLSLLVQSGCVCLPLSLSVQLCVSPFFFLCQCSSMSLLVKFRMFVYVSLFQSVHFFTLSLALSSPSLFVALILITSLEAIFQEDFTLVPAEDF